jgi:hypothetical protein
MRRFVLGDLDDESRRAIEAEAIENEELFERIEAIEDELIDEYLSDELPASERKIFEESLDTVPGRRRRVAIVEALAARKAAESSASNVAEIGNRVRYANHARFAIAAGFAAAAITAVAFFQLRQTDTSSIPQTPTASLDPSPAQPATIPATAVITPETSSALAVRKPGVPMIAEPSPRAAASPSAPVVSFMLVAATTRGERGPSTLEITNPESVVDFQVAIDDNEFSHYNAEFRAPDGSTVSSHREIPVTALRGAPVVHFQVPAASLRTGRHELILAGIHEGGTEEVAYLEFDVVKR